MGLVDLETQLRQKADQLVAIRDISRAIAEAEDLDATLDLITRRTTELMGVDSCSIYLYNREQSHLVLAATTGLKRAGIGKVSLAHGVGLTGWAAANRHPVAVADAGSDPRFERIVGSGESRFASLMAMPLFTRGRVIGAANVQNAVRRPFSAEEQELFGFIAELAAAALEKAKLVHAAVVQEIHHRVKNNLQTIAMLLRLQVAQANGLTAEDILHETINRVLSIAAVHEVLSQDQHSQVSIKQLVGQVAQSIRRSMTIAGQVTVTTSGDDRYFPSKPATSLALVTNELIQNALEHGLANQKTGHIDIQLTHTANDFRLTVTDNGQGLPYNFDSRQAGSLGLDLVYTMVEEDLAGTFNLANRPGGGTIAEVLIPLGLQAG